MAAGTAIGLLATLGVACGDEGGEVGERTVAAVAPARSTQLTPYGSADAADAWLAGDQRPAGSPDAIERWALG